LRGKKLKEETKLTNYCRRQEGIMKIKSTYPSQLVFVRKEPLKIQENTLNFLNIFFAKENTLKFQTHVLIIDKKLKNKHIFILPQT
jgi:hypothetical protein